MRKTILFSIIACMLSVCAFAQDGKPQLKWYGFVRNYYALDTRVSVSGTEDFFYYLPKDEAKSAAGEDLNDQSSFRFSALTSRLGLDVTGYEFNGWKMGAKIEADFYNGLSNKAGSTVTGTALLRLRQAYLTVSREDWTFKAGQAWHPMAADMPDVFSLNTGAPFGPFSRTPQILVEYNLTDGLSATAATIWQQQYCSAGPTSATNLTSVQAADFVKNGGGELYVGLNYKADALLTRLGVDVLTLSPRVNNGIVKVDEHITTVSPFFYAQYKSGKFTGKFKTIYAEAGEHMNLNGGYAISEVRDADASDPTKGVTYAYTPTVNSSSWLSLQYADKGWQYILFAGFAKNFGTKEAVAGAAGVPTGFFFSGNSFTNFNSAWRLTPTLIYNLGKLAIGLECEITNVEYGDKNLGMDLSKGLYQERLHEITNYRVQSMLKYTF